MKIEIIAAIIKILGLIIVLFCPRGRGRSKVVGNEEDAASDDYEVVWVGNGTDMAEGGMYSGRIEVSRNSDSKFKDCVSFSSSEPEGMISYTIQSDTGL